MLADASVCAAVYGSNFIKGQPHVLEARAACRWTEAKHAIQEIDKLILTSLGQVLQHDTVSFGCMHCFSLQGKPII